MKDYLTGTLRTAVPYTWEKLSADIREIQPLSPTAACVTARDKNMPSVNNCIFKWKMIAFCFTLSAAFLCAVTWNESIREQEPEEISPSSLSSGHGAVQLGCGDCL